MLDDKFTIDVDGLDEYLSIPLGLLIPDIVDRVKRDWTGRRYFDFPEPFDGVRVHDGVKVPRERTARLADAFRYFFELAKERLG